MPPETVQEKAQRLLDEGKVVELERGLYRVQGDTRAYLVSVIGDETLRLGQAAGVPPAWCHCEAHGACSHILSARALRRALERRERERQLA